MERIKVEYGKSMYGGWYANFYFMGKWQGIQGERKKDLVSQLRKFLGTGWEWGIRKDNI